MLLRRLRSRPHDPEAAAFDPDPEYLKELNEAYQHFFFHYNATPLLVVETSELDTDASDEAVEDLARQVKNMGPGTRYYVPRTQVAVPPRRLRRDLRGASCRLPGDLRNGNRRGVW